LVNKLNRYNRNAEAYAELSNGRITILFVVSHFFIIQLACCLIGLGGSKL